MHPGPEEAAAGAGERGPGQPCQALGALEEQHRPPGAGLQGLSSAGGRGCRAFLGIGVCSWKRTGCRSALCFIGGDGLDGWCGVQRCDRLQIPHRSPSVLWLLPHVLYSIDREET